MPRSTPFALLGALAVALVALFANQVSQAGQAGRAAIPYKPGPGPHAVAVGLYDWVDAARKRAVPVKIYSPKGGDGPYPVILFSHGLGSSRDTYEYLGRHWASYGYVVVHLQHRGSDSAILSGQDGEAFTRATSEEVAFTRPADVRFAIDRLAALNRDEPSVKGKLDLDRIGLAGHSYGAWTTLAVAGQVILSSTGRERYFQDPRVKAAISMSGAVPLDRAQHSLVYRRIKIPIFHMTGTLDDSPLPGGNKAVERRAAFDHITGADQYLVTFTGGDHMVFYGEGGSEKEKTFHSLIKMGSIAFWDAYLKGEPEARAWLSRGGFAGVLGDEGVFEEKVKG